MNVNEFTKMIKFIVLPIYDVQTNQWYLTITYQVVRKTFSVSCFDSFGSFF